MHFSPYFYLFAFLSVFCSSAAQVCQKVVAAQSGNRAEMLSHPYFAASLGFLAAGLAAWLVVLAHADISIAYPLLSANYILILLAARFIFKEIVPARRWFGILVIISGLSLLLSGGA